MALKETRHKLLLVSVLLPKQLGQPFTLNKRVLNIFDIKLNKKTRSTIKELISDEIFNEINKKEMTYSLSPKGLRQTALLFPTFRTLEGEWDGKWRILSYEIPENKRELRDRLRREVSSWGLGPWHRSFWITPHDIIPDLKELVKESEEQDYIQVFTADHSLGSRELLIDKVWQPKALEKKYRALFKQWHQILSEDKTNEKKMERIIDSYTDVLKIDPGLPKSLVGKDWISFEAHALFSEIRTILLK